MNDDDLITAVRDSFTDVHSATPVERIVSRSRAVRARRRIPGLAAALAVTAAAVLAVTALLPAHQAGGGLIAAPALRARLLAAIDIAGGDVLYTRGGPAPGGGNWQFPAYPQPGQQVRFRVLGLGSDGKVYKDGEYSFKMPSETALHDYINNYTANLDQGGLQLSGTAMAVDHFNHTWRQCHSKFILGFTLGAAGIRAEIANGQFTVVGRTELHGRQAIELKINVPPSNEAPPHTTAERLWVNATTYLPMRQYQRMSNGQRSVFDYVFLPPTPENLAKLRPVIPAGYTRSGCT
ncbi:MAG TPA: hypothetical protein VEH31_18535 [Streptosporangiaceae bacterium]|nr:hypothetical protein [Streptosporangiaceae bacterium]